MNGPRRFGAGGLATLAIVTVLFLSACYFGVVFLEVSHQAEIDEARPADAIVILGAAQYWGRPSPVLKARLDHALDLYHRGLAPRLITTGGHGEGAKFSEGEVSRNYLSENGVPAENVLVETSGQSTMQSAAAVVEIMRRMEMDSCVVVSDDYHILRVKRMLEEQGLTVYGSPRRTPQGDAWARRKRYARESFSYILWRIGIRV